MRHFFVLLSASMLILLSREAAAERPILLTEFGTSSLPAIGRDGKPNERVTGVLPEGWTDDSAWAKVWGELTIQEDDERRFLRAHISRKESGDLQLAYVGLEPITSPTRLRLTGQIRNLTQQDVIIGLRMSDAPFKMVWQTRIRPTERWNKISESFAIPELSQKVGLWVIASAPGVLDLHRLQLEVDAGTQTIRTRVPGGSEANLLAQSRFPLGLPAGWMINSKSPAGATFGTDGKVVGPTGIASLSFNAASPMQVESAPFAVVKPADEHAVALWVQGGGKWTLEVLADRKSIAKTQVGSGEKKWERVSLSFKPEATAKVHTLKLEGAGELWIDGVQVALARDAGTYSAAGKTEVALAVPEGEASVARIQFEDEPAVLGFAVTGEFSGAVLKSTVTNVYGQSQPLPDVPLEGATTATGELKYGVFPSRPLGGFRVLSVVYREGKPISPPVELIVYRLPKPRYWGKDAPHSPFGVHVHAFAPSIVLAKAIGINWVRLHDTAIDKIGWYNLEPKPGEWRFFDSDIQLYRTHHMKINAQLGTVPTWASYYATSGRTQISYWDKYFQPRDLSQFAEYVAKVVTRYKGIIDTYHVWNEPWFEAWWAVRWDPNAGSLRDGYKTSAEPHKDFAKLQEVAYSTAKRIDPNLTIVGVNTTPGALRKGSAWTAGMLQHGGWDTCDVADYHHYQSVLNGYPTDPVKEGFDRSFAPVVEARGKIDKPVWMSEGQGATNMLSSGFYDVTLPYVDNEDYVDNANRQCRYVLSLLTHGVSRVFLYSMGTSGFGGSSDAYRVVEMQDGALHPAGAAHAVLAWHLEDAKFAKWIELEDGAYAALFDSPRGAVAVLSALPAGRDYVVPNLPGTVWRDLFGNTLAAGTRVGMNLSYLSAEVTAAELEKMLLPK